jgi:diacylglycerol kinase (ATP)
MGAKIQVKSSLVKRTMKQAMIVYNPAAGRYPSYMLTQRAARVLETHGWQVQLEQTSDSAQLIELARKAVEDSLDALFVAGGDGSLNQALEPLVGSRTALGVLPAGTANVWAQELGLPGLSWTRWMALEESARRLAVGQVRCVDVGVCNERYFLLWAGIGLDAFVVHRIEPRSPWEKHFSTVQYAASAVWHASFWRGSNLNIEVDGERVSGHYLLALVSNIHLYAGGLAKLSPSARLDDGNLELWLFEGETLGDTVQLAWDLWAGRHVESDRVSRIPFRRMLVRSDSEMYFQTDGEPLDIEADAAICVKPRALRVLVPESVPHPLFMEKDQYDE